MVLHPNHLLQLEVDGTLLQLLENKMLKTKCERTTEWITVEVGEVGEVEREEETVVTLTEDLGQDVAVR